MMNHMNLNGARGLRVPRWAEGRIRVNPSAVIVCAQFYVRHVGYHEEWYVYDRQMVDHDQWCRAIVVEAREALNAWWPGAGRDMIVTGVARYAGAGAFTEVVHVRDLPPVG